MTNKQLVNKFYKEVLGNGDLSNLDNFMNDDYIQHDPNIEDHKKGFIKFIDYFLDLDPKINVINISEDENMSYVFFKCSFNNGRVDKVCDIYRIEDNKLVEHWDVIERNVENIKSKNNNNIF